MFRPMDSPRDCRGRTQPKQKQSQKSASSSADQSPNAQFSAPNTSSPNNAQGDSIARNEISEKAESRSRRFSRARKRPEDKSSTVATANQTDAANQLTLNNVQDSATNETGRQNKTRKRRKRRARTRREENVSDSVENDGNGELQNDATGKENGNHSGVRQEEQKRQRGKPEMNKAVALKGIDNNSLSKDSSQEEATATAEERRVHNNGAQQQGQQVSRKRSEQKITTVEESGQKKLSQSSQLNGASRDLDEPMRQDQLKKQDVRGGQTAQTMANSRGKELPQNDRPNGTTGEGGSQDNTKKQGQKRTRNRRKSNNRVLVESESAMSQTVPQDGPTRRESGSQNGTRKRNTREGRTRAEDDKCIAVDDITSNPALSNNTPNDVSAVETGIQTGASRVQDVEKEKNFDTLDVNNNSSQTGDMQVKTTQNGITDKRLDTVPDKDPTSDKKKAKKRKQKTGSQIKAQSLEAMRNLLSESPEEIVNWLILQQSSLFGKKQQKRKDEVVALLLKLLAKACDCECPHTGLGNLFSVLSKSWFLTRRVGPILDQLAAKLSRRSQTKHFDLETIRDLAKVLKEILNRFPEASAHLPIVKLHSSTVKLARSGELMDRGLSSTVQELMKLRKKEEVTRCRQEATPRSRPVKTGNVLR